jgi:predicted nucleic acid-binding protein
VTLVVDASVAIKWIVEEVDSRRAKLLRGLDEPLIAPELVVAEICNAMWKLVVRRAITEHQANGAIRTLGGAFDDLIGLSELAEDAFALARVLDHSAYDCFYAALALREGAVYVTCDAPFLRALRRSSLALTARTLDEFG